MKNRYKTAVTSCPKLFLFLLMLFSFSTNAQQSMRANLYVMDGNAPILMDGNLTEYSETYSNEVDIYDAWKLTNFGMNLGILRSGYNLSVERRHTIKYNDSTFFRMWNMSRNNYRIKLILKNLNRPGIDAIVKDNYLRTEIPVDLDDTTDINFTVDTNPASASEMRFQLIFRSNVPRPPKASFIATQAMRKGRDVMIQWQVSNEQEVTSYIVERSENANDFTAIYQVAPSLNGSQAGTYYHRDPAVSKMEVYYRVRATDFSGARLYSPIIKISETDPEQGINVYPNPVVNKTVQLQFSSLPSGRYNILLLSSNGMQYKLPSLVLNEWQVNASLHLPAATAPGIYRIQFMSETGAKIIKTINVL